jgi:hypothetical protein
VKRLFLAFAAGMLVTAAVYAPRLMSKRPVEAAQYLPPDRPALPTSASVATIRAYDLPGPRPLRTRYISWAMGCSAGPHDRCRPIGVARVNYYDRAPNELTIETAHAAATTPLPDDFGWVRTVDIRGVPSDIFESPGAVAIQWPPARPTVQIIGYRAYASIRRIVAVARRVVARPYRTSLPIILGDAPATTTRDHGLLTSSASQPTCIAANDGEPCSPWDGHAPLTSNRGADADLVYGTIVRLGVRVEVSRNGAAPVVASLYAIPGVRGVRAWAANVPSPLYDAAITAYDANGRLVARRPVA